MKKETQVLKRWAAGIMLAFAMLVGGSQATFAQEATPGTGGTTVSAQQNNNDDDGFPWGLLGLLGLAGLAGLRPQRNEVQRVDRTTGTTGTR
ncbi:MAG: WGxxGxxG-CTERM domain-containing protein [Chloroflexota bacterium]|nr:WGxxGxxG-CTERM domain-containing protein [Chloroflexota bacterium]MDQ5866644.1 WGxxGxxG-CTERM domain-containing protein [Chloroflexota bacterium]